MESLESITALRRVRPAALAAVVANVGIVVTGGIVRVTASGLGCDQWPACDGSSIVPAIGEEAGWHGAIEFGNRLLTFLVLATAVWVVLAVRRHAPDRQDLQRLAWLQPVGVLGQALLGGITVLTDLNPLVVAAHFLLSMAVIAAAVRLHQAVVVRKVVMVSGEPARRAAVATGHADVWRWLGRLLVTVGAGVLVLGTLVTASGPHAGDPGTPRLPLDIRTIAVAHADAVWLLVGLTLATIIVGKALDDALVVRAGMALLVVELAQGGVGYLQYALGIPPALVSLHLLGAALVWIAVLWAQDAVATVGPRRAT